jgi:hypothetical protein
MPREVRARKGSRRAVRRTAVAAGIAAAAGSCLITRTSVAQSWAMQGHAGVGTGLEGGSAGSDGVSWQRARTRAVVGLDLTPDEAAYQAFGFRGFVELERSTSVGASVHYARWVAPSFGLFVGLTGVIAPSTLFGGEAGATFLIPLGKKVRIFIEPEIAALPIGSDLPKDSVIIWALLSAGLRFDL